MSAPALPKILLVEDEEDVVEMLTRAFRKAGTFQVITAADGAAGLRRAREEFPALIILDLMLPKLAGLEVCRLLRNEKRTQHIPIVMLTAKTEEVDRIVGLEFGADDYVTKPFSPREVVLRVTAILRRGQRGPADKTLVAGNITIDPERHEVRIGKEALALTALEFKLLSTLIQRRGRVQGRDRLLNEVWGYESVIDTRTVDTHVRRLREKLGQHGDFIETVRGFGYRFRDLE